jgi:bisphosphoglycerate-dependent phosphoglycerate mutase
MPTWTFVRHGQSVANREGWIAGHYDVPLTEQGEAEAIAARVVLVEPLPERAHATAANDAACTEARAQANAAKRTRAWGSVLEATSQRRCWSSAELRMTRSRLRVTAYAELGELERCVKEGAGSRDREIAARTALCRKKLSGS